MKFILLFYLFLPTQASALTCSLRSHETLGREVLGQIQDLRCGSKKRVHLTFDDGPHPEHTPLLLRELNLREVSSTFFVSTTNITPERKVQRAIVASLLDSGHTVGSHGHRHEAYDLRLNVKGERVSRTLTPKEQEEEILLSTSLLNDVTKNRFGRQKQILFRFPYGRGALPSDAELNELERLGKMKFGSRDRETRLKEYRELSAPLHAIASQGYGHLLWNHDSGDSGSSVPYNTLLSKAAFVTRNLRNLCSSSQKDIVALFHDIKAFNPEVVAVLIDLGQCLGLSFVDAPTVLSAQELKRAGTFIPKEKIQAVPMEKFEALAEVLKDLQPRCDKKDGPTPGSCYSESLNRYFADCEAGPVSICIRGKWYQKTKEKLQECHARGL